MPSGRKKPDISRIGSHPETMKSSIFLTSPTSRNKQSLELRTANSAPDSWILTPEYCSLTVSKIRLCTLCACSDTVQHIYRRGATAAKKPASPLLLSTSLFLDRPSRTLCRELRTFVSYDAASRFSSRDAVSRKKLNLPLFTSSDVRLSLLQGK